MMTELNKFGGKGKERLSARTIELAKKVENKYKNCVPYTTVRRVRRSVCLCIPW